MDRRHFLRSAGAAAAGGWALTQAGCAREAASGETSGNGGTGERASDIGSTPGSQPAAGGAFGSSLDRIGLQLYTVRSLMAENVDETLELVAGVGYREVELAGLFDRSAAQFRATLDRVGLTAPSTHHGIDIFRDGFERAAGDAATLGHEYLILPSLPRGDLASGDAVRRMADEMNGFGERCREAGLRFGFHNHAVELQEVDDVVPLRVFLEETDPELVTIEVDLFWMVHGGGDPLEYFAAYPGRFELCHVKDRTAAGDMVDVGAGVIDFPAIFAEAEQAGLRHYFVEHDTPGDAAASVTASYNHLAALR